MPNEPKSQGFLTLLKLFRRTVGSVLYIRLNRSYTSHIMYQIRLLWIFSVLSIRINLMSFLSTVVPNDEWFDFWLGTLDLILFFFPLSLTFITTFFYLLSFTKLLGNITTVRLQAITENSFFTATMCIWIALNFWFRLNHIKRYFKLTCFYDVLIFYFSFHSKHVFIFLVYGKESYRIAFREFEYTKWCDSSWLVHRNAQREGPLLSKW